MNITEKMLLSLSAILNLRTTMTNDDLKKDVDVAHANFWHKRGYPAMPVCTYALGFFCLPSDYTSSLSPETNDLPIEQYLQEFSLVFGNGKQKRASSSEKTSLEYLDDSTFAHSTPKG